MNNRALKPLAPALLALLLIFRLSAAESPEFARVAAILQERCLDCHSAPDPDASLAMDSFAALMKGGESGPALLPGKSAESLLVKMIEGTLEKDGKRRIMPPGKREKLKSEQIALIKNWIDAGAPAPADDRIARELVVQSITPKTAPPRSIFSLAYDANTKRLALGRMSEVELVSADAQLSLTNLPAPAGNINAVVFSPDGTRLFAAGGTPGLNGEIRIWDASTLKETRRISAHSDSIFALAISPSGKLLASGSYDQKIKIWDIGTGAELRTLAGHNGCVYSLAFRPDGKLLASGSGDRTVKLWDVETGARRDTLSQPLKEQYAVAFSPDGQRLAAAGVDNRIRVWEISADARETTNPLLYSKFAHDSPILRLAFSADGKSLASSGEDRLVKIWEGASLAEKRQLEAQPEWAPGLAFILDDKGLAVGRMDGSLAYCDPANGSVLRPARPEIARFEPRGVQRGITSRVQVIGQNFARVQEARSVDARIQVELEREGAALWLKATPAASLPRGMYEIYLATGADSSERARLYVDDIPQAPDARSIGSLPVAVWGAHRKPGDTQTIEFTAQAGQTIVFDGAAKSIGSKADLLLTLSDSDGKVLATNTRFDKSGDPLLAHRFASAGHYQLTVSELLLAGSPDHFYRVTVTSQPFVTALYPPARSTSGEVELIGFNLGSDSAIPFSALTNGMGGALQLDPERFRWRGEFKTAAFEAPLALEAEPNDRAAEATPIAAPGAAAGRIASGDREDWFRFEAKKDQLWIIETAAERLGSPLDTKIEIRDAGGKPILRTLLQAVRASAVTFRGIDSTTVDCRVENWEEMELNQYLYLQGEVVRLFRAPQGPDSGFNFYAANGKRRTYFDTTASAHANAEPCYIVEPHRPGEMLSANGLPTYPVYFENDDDAERKLGTDSKVYFRAPADGPCFVRVTDSRGFGGDGFIYTVAVREPHPDFAVRLEGPGAAVAQGSGQRFAFHVDRIDGFDGPITIEAASTPPGLLISTPLTVEQGHASAFGTIYGLTETNIADLKFIAAAQVNGQTISHSAGSITKLAVTNQPSLYVELEPREITLAPGETVPATIKIRRNGHNDLVTFQVDNLPHGVIVDNIGLNGVLIPKDQNEREIFLSAAKWVPETSRSCYAISNEAGRQTSRPVLIKIRKNSGKVAAR